MPTYEYRCASCGHHFERFSLKMSKAASVPCPQCGKQARRLISGGAGVHFKGSGFYATDYRNPSYKEAAKEEGPKKESSSGEGGGKKSRQAEKKPGAKEGAE
jgi:putative FmdB family regulatory protein